MGCGRVRTFKRAHKPTGAQDSVSALTLGQEEYSLKILNPDGFAVLNLSFNRDTARRSPAVIQCSNYFAA